MKMTNYAVSIKTNEPGTVRLQPVLHRARKTYVVRESFF